MGLQLSRVIVGQGAKRAYYLWLPGLQPTRVQTVAIDASENGAMHDPETKPKPRLIYSQGPNHDALPVALAYAPRAFVRHPSQSYVPLLSGTMSDWYSVGIRL